MKLLCAQCSASFRAADRELIYLYGLCPLQILLVLFKYHLEKLAVSDREVAVFALNLALLQNSNSRCDFGKEVGIDEFEGNPKGIEGFGHRNVIS